MDELRGGELWGVVIRPPPAGWIVQRGTQTVIARPSAFSGLPSALVVLVTILILLGVAAHAAVI